MATAHSCSRSDRCVWKVCGATTARSCSWLDMCVCACVGHVAWLPRPRPGGARLDAVVLYSFQSQVNEREAEGETEGEGGGKCACMHVCGHSPLTTPPSASAAASPPPPHTIVGIDACRTQCGGCAVCWEECFAEFGPARALVLAGCLNRPHSASQKNVCWHMA